MHSTRHQPQGAPPPAARAPNEAPGGPPVSRQAEQEIQRLHRYIAQKLAEIEQVYQYSPVGLVLMDMDYRFVRINKRMADINGPPVEAHIGRTLREVVPDLADYLIALYRPVYERGEPVLNIEIDGRTPKEPDVLRHWLANFFPFRSETGEVIGLIGAVIDITERKRQEASLRESEERFRTIFESVTDAIFVHDIAAGKFVDVNQRAVDMFGFSRDELLASSIPDLSEATPDLAEAEARTRIESAMAGNPQTFEWRCKKKGGAAFWVEIGCRAAKFGGRDHLLATVHDIDARKDAEDRLTRLSRFDTLTGLANRRAFVAALEGAIADRRRRRGGVAILFLDLDSFKDVNDTLGHPVGDRLLQAVARRLSDSVRSSDLVARFGGDEFAVLIREFDEPSDAGTLARTLVDAIKSPFRIDANQIRIGVSIGIATFESDMDAETLLSRADVALYRSKSEGRGTYRFFSEAMDLEIHARVKLDAELRAAIEAEQFALVYQPQVNLDTGRITGVEALLRWAHPTRGTLSPALFIPVAERTGLIGPIGAWVLAQACRQARRWLDAGVALNRVAVNLSALQFKAPRNLENEIHRALAETGLPGRMVELELTEGTVLEASGHQGDILRDVRRLGVTIAIDDFGTGYSSLSYLRRFSVDRIKLAREFVADLATDANDRAIAQAAIGLARNLGIDMIAEGVETAEQLELLRSWGCREAQGFYLAKPMSAEELTPLLRRGVIGFGVR
jgi:diguanylate cyclase (GGDEF)-like protein/PAS domain S-box-containing protein